MSVVVADTSPLNYLIQCDAADVLPKLYQQIFVPQAVLDELSHLGAPRVVREWLERRPAWVAVRLPARIDPTIALGRGEVEAICLAEEIRADEILLDDRRARTIAQERGLVVSGTLGVIEAAASHDLLLLPDVLGKLEQTNFRIEKSLLEEALRRDALRFAARERARPPGRGIER